MTLSDSTELRDEAPHPVIDAHRAHVANRLNWLRAGVLGANDGIVSTSGLVVGVAAATTAGSVIFAAGLAGLVAGAVSMALGEYVSVSTQRDTQRALLEKERQELAEMPDAEFEELAGLYAAKGLSAQTARQVARELTERDAFAAHVDVELGIDPDELSSPWQAALSSAVAFTLGAVVPLIAILLPPNGLRVPVAFFAVLMALAVTGTVSAVLGGAKKGRAILRVVFGGALAMVVTYGVGHLVGTTI
ncbi:MAG: vacuolar iron transporter family protein [Mycobacterium sp.]|jgi:VIT1/CCC1 family predicted Fe2+/Mn2+ transporter|nr:vacuolar iron transporter family protein [Mycobacterium sp.]MDT5281646.1 vacuolar iron transporter family protein [Mycobacterium sp.]